MVRGTPVLATQLKPVTCNDFMVWHKNYIKRHHILPRNAKIKQKYETFKKVGKSAD